MGRDDDIIKDAGNTLLLRDSAAMPDVGGSLQIVQPQRYVCSRHGEHDAVMFAYIYDPADKDLSPFTPRSILLQRNYCMHCYIEHLDKAGVRDMDLVLK